MLNTKYLIPNTKKFWQKAIITLLALIVIGTPLLYLALFNAKTSYAAWYDDNWAYRQAVTVTVSSSSSDISNLETLLTIDTTGITAKVQTSCEDLRFTNTNGKLLPYYIDTCSDNSATNKVWVQADLVPKNTTTYTMYMYYGNPAAASASDSTKFRLFNGLVGYWTMNESSWNGTSGEVKDSSVNSNNGTAQNGATTTSSSKYSYAGSFDGSNDYVSIPHNSGLNSMQTVSAWIKTNSQNTVQSIVQKKQAATGGQYYALYIDSNNNVTFYINGATAGNGASTPTNSITTGTWTFVVGTYDGSTIKTYINGQSSGTPVSLTAGDYSNSNNFYIGIHASTTAQKFNGTMDEVRVYNRALSADEVTQLYTNPGTIASTANSTVKPTTSFATEEKAPSPVAYWSFDDGTGTTAQDSTTNNNDGTLSGTTKPTWQTEDQCVSGKCLYFDGTTSNVTVANAISGVQTVSMWVKPNTLTSALIDLDGGTHKITVNSSGVVSATGFTSPTIYANGVVASTLTANTWQYITVTTGTSFNSTSSLTIGKSSTTFLKGFIDEVKIYPYARSAAQILADYNARGTSKGAGAVLGGASNNNYSSSAARSLSNGLVGYWKMDEASANTCTGGVNDSCDSSGNSKDGAWNGDATSAAGKFGNAVSLDGTGDFISISSVGPYTDFTYSAWAYNSGGSGDDTILGHSNTTWNWLISDKSNNYFKFVTYNSTLAESSGDMTTGASTLSANIWQQIVITVSSTSSTRGTVRMYLNGVLKSTYTNKPLPSNPIDRVGYGNNGNTYQGSLDETRIYNRALSPSEVSQLYNFAPGPRVELKMEEGSGTTANDTSGNSNTGTVNTGTWTQGKYGKGVNLNGTSGSDVSVPDFAY